MILYDIFVYINISIGFVLFDFLKRTMHKQLKSIPTEITFRALAYLVPNLVSRTIVTHIHGSIASYNQFNLNIWRTQRLSKR